MHPSPTTVVGRLALLGPSAVLTAFLLTLPPNANAQTTPSAQGAVAALPATAAVGRSTAQAPRPPLPEQLTVIEDDGARIEETRRRGQVVRVQVHSKVGNAGSYDIVVKPSAEPASQQRGTAGRSAWQLFSF